MKPFMIIAALATVAASTIAYTPAQARDGAVAAGVVGGLAAGAIIGSAAAQRNYYTGPAYVEPSYSPVYGACHIEREQVVDAYGYARIRRVRVCD
jgi:hypothetical protein